MLGICLKMCCNCMWWKVTKHSWLISVYCSFVSARCKDSESCDPLDFSISHKISGIGVVYQECGMWRGIILAVKFTLCVSDRKPLDGRRLVLCVSERKWQDGHMLVLCVSDQNGPDGRRLVLYENNDLSCGWNSMFLSPISFKVGCHLKCDRLCGVVLSAFIFGA